MGRGGKRGKGDGGGREGRRGGEGEKGERKEGRRGGGEGGRMGGGEEGRIYIKLVCAGAQCGTGKQQRREKAGAFCTGTQNDRATTCEAVTVFIPTDKSPPTRITSVVIRLHLPLRDLEVVLRHDLVERKGASAEDLARIAMARETKQRRHTSAIHSHTESRTAGHSTDQRICAASGTLAVHSTCPQWHRPLYSVIMDDCLVASACVRDLDRVCEDEDPRGCSRGENNQRRQSLYAAAVNDRR